MGLRSSTTSLRASGRWRYIYRAVDERGQIIDVCVSARRNAAAARAVLHPRPGVHKVRPVEVVTDRALAWPIVVLERP
ncbi:MAG TPA: DDE-type integrase/transposase/recombinase [Chloroflexota bacterium]